MIKIWFLSRFYHRAIDAGLTIGTAYEKDVPISIDTKEDLITAESTIKKIQKKIGFRKFITDTNVVKISVVGNAMRTQSGIAKTMFETLAKNQINIHVISTSEIKISVLISSDYYELAMRSLHSAFGLDV